MHKNPANPDYSRIQTKFIIKKEVKNMIRSKLRRIGITKSFIYPSLESLAYDILEVTKLGFQDRMNLK